MVYWIISIIIVLTLFIGWFVAYVIYHPHRHSYEDTYENEVEKGHISEAYIAQFNVKDVEITSEGLNLKAHYIDQGSDKTILFMHGYTYTRFGSYKYAPMFLDRGYNVLMPDERYHGHSEGKRSTLGIRESKDCLVWIKYIKTITPQLNQLGLHGESMGAATVLHTAANNSDIDFVISDCAFSQFEKQVRGLMWKQNKIPTIFIYSAEIFARLFGTTILKNNPVDSLKNVKVPVLLIHGKDDTYIPINHFEELKQVLKSEDKTYVCDGANHAMSYETNNEDYVKHVYDFLDSIQK